MAETLEQRIKRHEAFRGRPYVDTLGHVTIGYGRNLEANPLSRDEADHLFRNDMVRAQHAARTAVGAVFEHLPPVAREVLVEMAFQLGVGGLSGFKRMLAAVREQEWERVGVEMLDSLWARQTPGRARALADMVGTLVQVSGTTEGEEGECES